MPADLAAYVRDIPDFPRPGILFRDITPLMASPEAFRTAVQGLADYGRGVAADLGIGGVGQHGLAVALGERHLGAALGEAGSTALPFTGCMK